jgi:hypothetical protein
VERKMSVNSDGIPMKYASNIKTTGYDGLLKEHGGTLEIEFENGLEIIIHDVPKESYEALISSKLGYQYYFFNHIYPEFKDQIITIKDI